MSVAFQANNLTIGYQVGNQQKTVAGPLNFKLNKGELICIMGANGIGKSTLLRTIAGLQKPISGKVEINQNDIHLSSNQERAKLLSIVLTTKPNFNLLTVRQLVELGRYPYTNWRHILSSNDQLAVNNAISAVGLEHDSEKQIAELSDGNMQKAMIARALAQETELILLDEPTIHLDLKNKLMVLHLLAKLSKQYKKSILIASHDLNMMIQLADKLWLFQKDKLVMGTPEDLMYNGAVDEIIGSEKFELSLNEIKMRSSFETVWVQGDSELKYWLERALLRNGYSISKDSPIKLVVNKTVIELIIGNHKQPYQSIEETLIALENTNL